MSELDGLDAFDRVLEKLIDAQAEVVRANDRAREAEASMRDAGQKLEATRTENHRLKSDAAKALPVLKELYEAAEDLAKSTFAKEGDKSARVLKALTPAHVYCDQEIPF